MMMAEVLMQYAVLGLLQVFRLRQSWKVTDETAEACCNGQFVGCEYDSRMFVNPDSSTMESLKGAF